MKMKYFIDPQDLKQILAYKNVALGLANYFSRCLAEQVYAQGQNLPSLNEICEATGIGMYKTRGAFAILRQRQQVQLRNGRNAVVASERSILPEEMPENSLFYVNYNLKISHKLVLHLEQHYRQLKYDFRDRNLPVKHWGDYLPLRKTVSKLIFARELPGLGSAHIFYQNSLPIILRMISEIIGGCGGIFAIPAGNYNLRKNVEIAGVKLLTFGVDRCGVQVSDLAEICAVQQLTAVFIMSRANYPDTVYTTAERITELFTLQRKYNFRIIDICAYEPLLSGRRHLLLQLAGVSIEAVIVVQPISYIVEEMNETFVVAADPLLIEQLQLRDKAQVGRKCRLKAHATNEIIRSAQYKKTFKMLLHEIRQLRVAVDITFRKCKTWKPEGLSKESGVVLYLMPQRGAFRTDVFDQLQQINIWVIDPLSYWEPGSKVTGIRIDLSLYIGKQNLPALFRELNRSLQRMVVSPG